MIRTFAPGEMTADVTPIWWQRTSVRDSFDKVGAAVWGWENPLRKLLIAVRLSVTSVQVSFALEQSTTGVAISDALKELRGRLDLCDPTLLEETLSDRREREEEIAQRRAGARS